MRDSIKEYWMDIGDTLEFRAISQTEDIELNLIKDKASELVENQFISLARESGIARRERLLGIQPFADDTLEVRRFRVAGKWDSSLPYTYRGLVKRLDLLCGEGRYTLELDPANYTLKVRIELIVKRLEDEVRNIVKSMCPANLLIVVELRYRRYEELKPYTHEQLKTYTHNQLKEGEL